MTDVTPTSDLSLTGIPGDSASPSDLIAFADSFDSYSYAGSHKACAEIANNRQFRSIGDIRAALFFEARRWRHMGEAPDDEALSYWRSLVDMIRQRLQLIDTATPAWLSDAIRALPSDEPVPKGTQGYNEYQTQKDHWLGWLNPSAGTVTYPRSTGADAPARKVYNRIAEPKMLLWLASAAGVAPEVVAQARAAAEAEPRFMSKCGAVRKFLPWPLVADALMSQPKQRPSGVPPSQRRDGEVTPEEIEALLLQTARPWNIPADLAKQVIRRDLVCIYCRQPFVGPDGDERKRASWEHIVNDLSLVTLSNIALSCHGCNSSKRALPLEQWLESNYCLSRSITRETIAPVAARAIQAP
jgi:hypothetical protein